VGDDDLLRAKLWYTRGMVYSDAGRLDESQALVSKALALFEKHGDEHEAMAATNGLGIDADLRGHVEEAAEYYRRVIAWRERVLGPDHPEVAIALNNLGTMMNEHGEHADAAPILERALAIRQRVFAPDNRLVGFSLTGLSEVYVYIGREAEALALAQRGLAITEKAYGASSPRLAFALEGFIAALLRLKRYAEAVAPAERALAIRQKAEVVGLAIDSAKKDLGIALVRSGRDPERGRAMLADARGDLAQKGRTEWVAEIDEALAAP
jgi:Flp pilus assembly protein TadD